MVYLYALHSNAGKPYRRAVVVNASGMLIAPILLLSAFINRTSTDQMIDNKYLCSLYRKTLYINSQTHFVSLSVLQVFLRIDVLDNR